MVACVGMLVFVSFGLNWFAGVCCVLVSGVFVILLLLLWLH